MVVTLLEKAMLVEGLTSIKSKLDSKESQASIKKEVLISEYKAIISLLDKVEKIQVTH